MLLSHNWDACSTRVHHRTEVITTRSEGSQCTGYNHLVLKQNDHKLYGMPININVGSGYFEQGINKGKIKGDPNMYGIHASNVELG